MAMQLVEVLEAFPHLAPDEGLAVLDVLNGSFGAAAEESTRISVSVSPVVVVSTGSESGGVVAAASPPHTQASSLASSSAPSSVVEVVEQQVRVLKAALKWSQGRKEVGAFKLVRECVSE